MALNWCFIAALAAVFMRSLLIEASPPCIGTVAGRVAQQDINAEAQEYELTQAASVAVDNWGNIFVADYGGKAVAMVGADKRVIRAAGTATAAYFADNKPADQSGIYRPYGIAVPVNDTTGDVYIVDAGYGYVHRIGGEDGQLHLVAGYLAATLWWDYQGDGGPATLAMLNAPSGVAVDAERNVWIADTYNHRIRRVSAQTGIIETVIGTGDWGYTGDGGPASEAEITGVWHLSLDRHGNVVFVDADVHVVRIYWISNGTLSTLAGSGVEGYTGDGGPATAATMSYPQAVVADQNDNLFIADDNNVIRVVWKANGTIDTLVGTGAVGSGGDGGPARLAELQHPYGLTFDLDGNLLIADTFSKRIRKVWLDSMIITSVVQNANTTQSGEDGNAATSVKLLEPYGLAFMPNGDLLISSGPGANIQRMSLRNRTVELFAGAGTGQTISQDGVPATSTTLAFPQGIAATADGDVLFADSNAHTIRKVFANGTIVTVAGVQRVSGFSDGGPATMMLLNFPSAVAVHPQGHFYIADSSNACVRMVNITSGNMSTYAGACKSMGDSGDGGKATEARLGEPVAVALDAAGNLYICDRNSTANRVRVVLASSGTIVAFAGVSGPRAFAGDGGLAISAKLSNPLSVMVDNDRGFVYIADSGNYRLRRVDLSSGIITTVAGTGTEADGGDNGPATSANLGFLACTAIDASGNVFMADLENNRIRVIMFGSAMTCPAGYTCPCGQPVPCPSAGSFCMQDQSEPASVSKGFYSVPATLDGTRRVAQRRCPLGFYCMDGIKSPCNPGTYGVAERQATAGACPACPAGMYNPLYAQVRGSACVPCPAGTVGGEGGAFCSPCDVHAIVEARNSTHPAVEGSKQCMPCPANTVALPGMTACVPLESASVTLTQAFAVVQLLDMPDPTASNAEAAGRLQVSIAVPLALFALLPFLRVLMATSDGGVSLSKSFTDTLRAVDLYGMRHALQQNQSPTLKRTPLGGACSFAAVGTIAAIAVTLVVQYAVNNVLVQKSVLPALLPTLVQLGKLPPSAPASQAPALVDDIAPTFTQGIQLQVLAMGASCYEIAFQSSELLSGSFSLKTTIQQETQAVRHTFDCSDCSFGPLSAINISLDTACRMVIVRALALGASQSYTLTSFTAAAPTPTFMQATNTLAEVRAVLQPTLEVYEDVTSGVHQRGYTLLPLSVDTFHAHNPTIVSIQLSLGVAPSYVLLRLAPLLSLPQLASSIVGLSGLLGAFGLAFMAFERKLVISGREPRERQDNMRPNVKSPFSPMSPPSDMDPSTQPAVLRVVRNTMDADLPASMGAFPAAEQGGGVRTSYSPLRRISSALTGQQRQRAAAQASVFV